MLNSTERSGGVGKPGVNHKRAQARVLILAVVFLAAGFAAGAFWYYHFGIARPGETITGDAGASASAGLSDATKAVLKRLDQPVEIRYYSVLDPKGADDSLKAFAGWVDQLMSAYQQEAGDKLKVVRHQSLADDSTAAFNDGLKAFNQDKGDACYLGIVVTMGTQKELLPQLSPDWQAAVEPDLTRAIARLLSAPPPAANGFTTLPANPRIVEEVKTAIPNFASVSLEDGTRTLQMAAVQEYSAAANEMSVQMKEAQQRLVQAKNDGSDSEQQAAMQAMQELQAAQSEKLRKIAAQSKGLIDAFKQLKQSTK